MILFISNTLILLSPLKSPQVRTLSSDVIARSTVSLCRSIKSKPFGNVFTETSSLKPRYISVFLMHPVHAAIDALHVDENGVVDGDAVVDCAADGDAVGNADGGAIGYAVARLQKPHVKSQSPDP